MFHAAEHETSALQYVRVLLLLGLLVACTYPCTHAMWLCVWIHAQTDTYRTMCFFTPKNMFTDEHKDARETYASSLLSLSSLFLYAFKLFVLLIFK